jgi:hypothetical protein
MKDYKKIDEILTRYWQCETSVEEERILQDFFLQMQEIPEHLRQYKSLFEYREMQQAEKLSADFDEKILRRLKPQKAKRIKLHFPQAFKIAASIALLIGFGLSAHLYQVRVEQMQARDTVLTALFMISDNLQKGEEMILKGLEEFEIVIN